MSKNTKTVKPVWVEESLQERFKVAAAQAGKSMTAIAEELLREFLERTVVEPETKTKGA